MRIVWVSQSGALRGGAELCLLEGAEALSQLGASVHIIAPEPGDLVETAASRGFHVSVTPYREWARFWEIPWYRRLVRPSASALRLLKSGARLSALIRPIAPDVVVTNTLAIGAGAVAARALGIPHVWHIHEFGKEDHGMRFDLGERLSVALLGLLSDRIVVASEAVARKFETGPRSSKIRLVRYAVDVPPAPVTAPRSGIFRLVIVGRLTPRKGQAEAIRALAIARADGLNAELVIVGGDLESTFGVELQNLARALGVTEHVRFVGFTEDPFPLISASDALLMCSQCEAFGRVTVEAMKLGKPVIGSRRGGTMELIREDWNGFLYEPGRPEELAAKIALLSHDRALLKRLGVNAREWSTATFTPHGYGLGLLHALEEAVASRNR